MQLHSQNYIQANLDLTPWTREAMAKTLSELRPDVVFSLLGTTRARTRRAEKQGVDASYSAVDYGLTVRLMQALSDADLRPRFVYLSSMGAGGKAKSAYMAARATTESAVRESGLPFTIARPSFITGPDREDGRMGERIGSAMVDGLLAVVGVLGGSTLRAQYRSTTNTRLADSLIRLALDPAAENQVVLSDALR